MLEVKKILPLKYTLRKRGTGTRKYIIYANGKIFSNYITRKEALKEKRLLNKRQPFKYL